MSISINILSSPTFTDAHVKFLDDIGLQWLRDNVATPAENLVEFAGRICYLSFGEGRQAPATNAQYIHKLINKGHDSVLEHATWSFIISGISRSFTHQLVRHRVGFSYSQLSQQYHDESDALFLEPAGLDRDPVLRGEWLDTMSQLRGVYKKLLDSTECDAGMDSRESLRLRRSLARSVLPNAVETKIVVTANARALRHFLDVRGSIIGDPEMRLVSQRMLGLLKLEAPALFADFVELQLEDGWPVVKKVENKQGEA